MTKAGVDNHMTKKLLSLNIFLQRVGAKLLLLLSFIIMGWMNISAWGANQLPKDLSEADLIKVALVGEFLSLQGKTQEAAELFITIANNYGQDKYYERAVREIAKTDNYFLVADFIELWRRVEQSAQPDLFAINYFLNHSNKEANRKAEDLIHKHYQHKNFTVDDVFLINYRVNHSIEEISQRLVRIWGEDTAVRQKYYLAMLAYRDSDNFNANLLLAKAETQDQGDFDIQLAKWYINYAKHDWLELGSRRLQALALLEQINSYVARSCPGAKINCDVAEVLLSYQYFKEAWENWWQGHGDVRARIWEQNLKEATKDTQNLATYQLGLSYLAQQDWSMAKEIFLQIDEQSQWYFSSQIQLARLEQLAEQYDLAIERLINLNPADAEELYRRESVLATLLVINDRGDDAISRLDNLTEQNPNSYEYLYFNAHIIGLVGYHDRAISVLREINQHLPKSPDAQNALGYTLADYNQSLDEATVLIRQALAIYPDDPSYIDSLGWLFYRQGKYDLAKLHLQNAASKLASADIFAHLGEVYWQLGDEKNALKYWQIGFEIDPTNLVLLKTLERFSVDI